MEIGDVYERKNYQYKVVAKVQHETKEDIFVYLIAQREFGIERVEYFSREREFGNRYEKTNYWLG